LVISIRCCQAFGFIAQGEFINELVDIPIHDALDIVGGIINAVISDPALREIIRSDLFRTVAGANL
jgi:hypothetical protein